MRERERHQRTIGGGDFSSDSQWGHYSNPLLPLQPCHHVANPTDSDQGAVDQHGIGQGPPERPEFTDIFHRKASGKLGKPALRALGLPRPGKDPVGACLCTCHAIISRRMTIAPSARVTATDGRLARSRSTRAAVVEALLALIESGDLQPTAPRIAERAGVSLRSVFQHFRDRETLFAAAADRQTQRLQPLLQPIDADLSFTERLATFVEQRAQLLETLSPVRRAALLLEPFSAAIATRLHAFRALKRSEIESVFAPEIATCPAADCRELLAALDAAGSYSTWHALRVHQDLPVDRARKVLTHLFDALLAGRTVTERRKHGSPTHSG